MQKENKLKNEKKKKLTILLIVIALIVIIGTIIIKNVIVNQEAKEENYLVGGNSNSSLIASNIKKGITIGGITGTLDILDTSDATATPEDIAMGKTAYAKGKKITGTRVVNIPDTETYTCCYADIDGDKKVDGIIFADLAKGNTGDGQWGDEWGTYTVSVKNNFKQYYISHDEYTDDFGTGRVIAPVEGSSGEDRFYVMSLDNIDLNEHYWYRNSYGKLDITIEYIENDFGKGKQNTETMINKWNNNDYGSQYSDDIWGIIQNENYKNWFVPSKTEWAVFGGEVLEKLDINSTNYAKYGLSVRYWSSTQNSVNTVYYAGLSGGCISNRNAYDTSYVRLATTF